MYVTRAWALLFENLQKYAEVMHGCLQGDKCLERQAACRVSLLSTLLTAVRARTPRQIGQVEDHELNNVLVSYELCSCCCPCRQAFHYGLSSGKLELCWRERGAD